jgi:hypothetical protein
VPSLFARAHRRAFLIDEQKLVKVLKAAQAIMVKAPKAAKVAKQQKRQRLNLHQRLQHQLPRSLREPLTKHPRLQLRLQLPPRRERNNLFRVFFIE